MGSCVSQHKNPVSAMKACHSLDSKDEVLFHPSPTKDHSINGGGKPVAVSGAKEMGQQFSLGASLPAMGSGKDQGSKDESFFDTQAWLESDCEDDFYSVNGDFTPSRNSTPNYQRSVPGTPRLIKTTFTEQLPESKPETSPVGKRKKLADLFKESLQDGGVDGDLSTANGNLESSYPPPKPVKGLLYPLGPNSALCREKTPSKYSKTGKEKKVKTSQCCFPGLATNMSFNEKKQQLPPVHQNGS